MRRTDPDRLPGLLSRTELWNNLRFLPKAKGSPFLTWKAGTAKLCCLGLNEKQRNQVPDNAGRHYLELVADPTRFLGPRVDLLSLQARMAAVSKCLEVVDGPMYIRDLVEVLLPFSDVIQSMDDER
jgi:hypothetical protein